MAQGCSKWPCAHETLPKEDAWKARPPYAIQSPEQFGPVQWRGRCHCGRITYSLNREKPLNAKFCHCRGCQLMHGLPLFPLDAYCIDAELMRTVKEPPSNGPLSSTKPASRLQKACKAWSSTARRITPASTRSQPRCRAPSATPLSWTRAATCVYSSRSLSRCLQRTGSGSSRFLKSRAL